MSMEHMDRKTAAKIDPIKDTPSLKEPITKYYLGKRLCQAESELPVDMRPIHQLSSISENPLKTETLTENPVVTEINVIGQGGYQAVIVGTHTQSIIDGRKDIIHSDVITQIITDHIQMSLKGDFFPFDKRRRRHSCSHLLLKPFWHVIGTYARQV